MIVNAPPLTLCSQREALTLLTNKSQHVCLITNPGVSFEEANQIPKYARTCRTLVFDDITAPVASWVAVPQPEHVQEFLDYVKGLNGDFIVCCRAGRSRSSAMAYLYRCTLMDPDQAISFLDPEFHIPNRKIVADGAKLLGDPKIVEVADAFMHKGLALAATKGEVELDMQGRLKAKND